MRRAMALGVAPIALLIVLTASAEPAGPPQADGWYSWDVAASRGGMQSCCYRFRHGKAGDAGCDLDGSRGGFSMSSDCAIDSERLRIYVRMSAGRAERVRAVSSDCPVTARSTISDLGARDTAWSVGWLATHISADGAHHTRTDSELIAAIAMHAGKDAFETLKSLLEDRDRRMKIREEALFWLVQSETDLAFDYLDRLLSSR